MLKNGNMMNLGVHGTDDDCCLACAGRVPAVGAVTYGSRDALDYGGLGSAAGLQ